ncbi:hypothetical protein JCM19232_639 [Vibrio ishigakensis]|uniref:Uncharacterized protein n=1 Tax=Vibrio ishigakensis TaxID=1481914 RepID=A0A0B8P261_9VIBR|nr:hypothetical protein JCM19232_639 [Vibrio ishigakensis]
MFTSLKGVLDYHAIKCLSTALKPFFSPYAKARRCRKTEMEK